MGWKAVMLQGELGCNIGLLSYNIALDCLQQDLGLSVHTCTATTSISTPSPTLMHHAQVWHDMCDTVGDPALSSTTTTRDRHTGPGGWLYILSSPGRSNCWAVDAGLSVQRKQLSNLHLLTQVFRYQSLLRGS